MKGGNGIDGQPQGVVLQPYGSSVKLNKDGEYKAFNDRWAVITRLA